MPQLSHGVRVSPRAALLVTVSRVLGCFWARGMHSRKHRKFLFFFHSTANENTSKITSLSPQFIHVTFHCRQGCPNEPCTILTLLHGLEFEPNVYDALSKTRREWNSTDSKWEKGGTHLSNITLDILEDTLLDFG